MNSRERSTSSNLTDAKFKELLLFKKKEEAALLSLKFKSSLELLFFFQERNEDLSTDMKLSKLN